MVYRVETTPCAERDRTHRTHIYRSIEAQASDQAAKRFNEMEEAINSLEDYPRRNPVTPENRSWRHLLYGKKSSVDRIVCKIEEASSTVYILHIRPPRRD